jgi:multiple antibiotic resistance protein
MDDLFGHTVSVFLGFFAIMNPIANAPVFLGLTAGDDKAVTRQVARNAILVTFVLIVIFCVLGKLIFELFGITLPAFRITGGVLVAKRSFRWRSARLPCLSSRAPGPSQRP